MLMDELSRARNSSSCLLIQAYSTYTHVLIFMVLTVGAGQAVAVLGLGIPLIKQLKV